MKTETLVFPENWYSKLVHFGILIQVMSWNIILDYWEKKTQTENQHFFEGIIEVTIFDGIEGLD